MSSIHRRRQEMKNYCNMRRDKRKTNDLFKNLVCQSVRSYKNKQINLKEFIEDNDTKQGNQKNNDNIADMNLDTINKDKII